MAVRKRTGSELNFEASLQKLEAIVKRLEEDEIPLETSLKLFAEGQTLARACEQQLHAAENQIRQLMEKASGKIEEEDFEPPVGGGDASGGRSGGVAGTGREAEAKAEEDGDETDGDGDEDEEDEEDGDKGEGEEGKAESEAKDKVVKDASETQTKKDAQATKDAPSANLAPDPFELPF